MSPRRPSFPLAITFLFGCAAALGRAGNGATEESLEQVTKHA